VPSTKRNGKDRAFYLLPSALTPTATPTLAFCLTTLPKPGMAQCALHVRHKRLQVGLHQQNQVIDELFLRRKERRGVIDRAS
jgi:hypothetical protein